LFESVCHLPQVGVHNLSPGMVLTDLLLKDASPVARRWAGSCARCAASDACCPP
jgi:hypothetical protein